MWYNKVKLTHRVCNIVLDDLYVYIDKDGKDRRNRDKNGFFVSLSIQYWVGYLEKKKALKFHCGSYEKFSILIKSNNYFIYALNALSNYKQDFRKKFDFSGSGSDFSNIQFC